MADQPPSLPQTSSALPPSRTEPLAIWSLVLAILSWFFCLLLGSIPRSSADIWLVPGFAGQKERFKG